MMKKIFAIYNSRPMFFWTLVFVSYLIISYLLILLALNDGYQFGIHYIRIAANYLSGWNFLNDRDVFQSLTDDKRQLITLPFYEIGLAIFSKYSGIDLYFSGRIINFLLFIGQLFLLLKFKNIFQSKILPLFLLYLLLVNQFFVWSLFSFHYEILNYLLITLSIYCFYRGKLISSYIIIFILAVIKPPHAFSLICFLSIEYFFFNSLYKENIFKIVKNEKIKIIMLMLLIVPVLGVDFYRNYLKEEDLFAISSEAKNNLFINEYFKYMLEYKLAVFRLYPSYDFSNYKNLFFVFLPFVPLIKKDIELFFKTIIFYAAFVFNYLLFLKTYLVHNYSFLGLAFVVIIILFKNYAELIKDFLGRLRLNKLSTSIIGVMLFSYFCFKIFSLNYYVFENVSENKAVTYIKKFVAKNKKTLVVSDIIDKYIKVGQPLIEREQILMNTDEFKKDCQKNIAEFEVILLNLNQSCLTELLLSQGNIYFDVKKKGAVIVWVKDKRLKKRNITDKVKINNFYREDLYFDVEKAKLEFKEMIYFEDNINIYRNNDKLFFIVKNCLSENMIEKTIALHLYYDFVTNLKLLYKKSLFKFDNQDISILGNSMIKNDTCYIKKDVNNSNNIKKMNFAVYVNQE